LFLDITIIAFASAVSRTSDTYAFSTANFPYAQHYQESKSLLPIKQAVWVVDASHEKLERELVIRARDGQEVELVPSTITRSISRQHTQPDSLFYVVTSEGVETIQHLKPVEMYRRILSNYGPDSRQFQLFLSIHGPLEICVMSLILLASEEVVDAGLKVRFIWWGI
jgi:hypothetical protein